MPPGIQGRGDLPCPRLYDLVGDPVVTGIVMDTLSAAGRIQYARAKGRTLTTNRGGHSSAPRPDNAIYALAGALKVGQRLAAEPGDPAEKIIVVNLSGRGDKDVAQAQALLGAMA